MAASAERSGRLHPVTLLYTVTAFLGAALLFVVQPMVARLLLPAYGGAATVWATCSLFFQLVLLLGYLFVHASTRLGARQPLVYLPLLLLPLPLLPLQLPADATPDAAPALWLLRTLLIMIGLPFAVLSTTGPVLQRWYSRLQVPRAEDPYFLYAASNLGSFAGLLLYPFLIEPYVSLAHQRYAWSIGFFVFLLLLAGCGARALRTAPRPRARGVSERPSALRMLRWVGLAFVPSSLMLGVITHVTTDVAPVPLLWVVPLAIYLATYVYAFARRSHAPPRQLAMWALVLMLLSKLVVFLPQSFELLAGLCLPILLLLAVALVAHRLLAADRPKAEQLTLYFVLISLGGALGGIFNGLLAPMLFDRILEYDLLLAAIPLLWLATGATRWIACVMSIVLLGKALGSGAHGLDDKEHQVLFRSRTFYGAYAVVEEKDRVSLYHGTTAHGMQMKEPAQHGLPSSYYAREGPLGAVFTQANAQGSLRDVTTVGLGTGTVSAYGEAGQTFRFVEIDPEMVRIASEPRFFDYLANSPAKIEMLLGDGRLQVASMPEKSIDLLILDAFSSDAIPVHLLTAEAFVEYASRIRENGAIAVHISNRYFDLLPVVAGAATQVSWRASWDEVVQDKPLVSASRWVVLSREGGLAEQLVATSGWRALHGTAGAAWSDEHASVWSALRFR